MSDFTGWRLARGHDGYYIVDRHGEEIGFAGTDYGTAKAALDEMIRDDIAALAQESEPYDRAQS